MDADQEAARRFVKEILSATGWTPNKLAKEARVSHTTISRFLHNQDVTHTLSARTLSKVRNAAAMNTGRSNVDIARRISATLAALKMNQAEFARRCGFDPPRVNNWLKANARPDIEAAHTICDHLPVTLDWIYRGDATKLPGDLQAKLNLP